jgi:hypothetical protein
MYVLLSYRNCEYLNFRGGDGWIVQRNLRACRVILRGKKQIIYKANSHSVAPSNAVASLKGRVFLFCIRVFINS